MLYLLSITATLYGAVKFDRDAKKYFHPTSLKTSIEMPLTSTGNKS